MDEPLTPTDARRRIREILESGTVAFRKHALDEMASDKFGPMTTQDAENVLRAGVVEPAEMVNDAWRYRVRTSRMVVVVAFRSDSELRVVTAWRLR